MTVHNRLDDAFEEARAESRAVLVPYLTAGSPYPDAFVDLAVAILDEGADALEIGIPFSDPLLDGPAIQRAQQAALEAGVTPVTCVEFARKIRERSEKPLLFMGAYNPIFAFGLRRFCAQAAASGIAALIVPDLPLEEQADLESACKENGLHLVQLVAPTSTPERIRHICDAASGFVYCISVAGVTGARSSVTDTARPLVDRVRQCTDLPIAVGFGIAGPDQARDVAQFADGVVVGSALVTLVASSDDDQRMDRVRTFIRGLVDALLASRSR